MPGRWIKLIIAGTALTAVLSPPVAVSQTLPSGVRAGTGGLMVAPTRLVFEGRHRSAEVTLVNTGTAPATYRIAFVQMRMREDGSFEDIEEPGPGELFAHDLVRYSPRQVTLEPHVPQTIRLQLRKPADLPPGEYRSHLLFRALPPDWTAPREGAGPSGIEIQLKAIYGISIPVIVRHGDTWAAARISDLAVRPSSAGGPTALGFAIRRQGTQSVYGDVAVERERPDGGREVVARMKGVAVYAPNAVRWMTIALPPAGNRSTGGERLRVTYVASGGGEPFAAAELVVP